MTKKNKRRQAQARAGKQQNVVLYRAPSTRGVAGHIPDRMVLKMRSFGTDLFNGTGGALDSIGLLVNSAHANGLNQPLGYDQISALYNKYCVTEAHLDVVFAGAETGSGFVSATAVGVAPSLQAAPFSGLDHMIEQPGGKWAVLNTQNNVDRVRMTFHLNIGRYVGVDDIMDDDVYHAAIGFSPSTPVYVTVGSQCFSAVQTRTRAHMCLTQTVVFFQRKAVALS